MATVEIRDVVKRFGGVEAIGGVSVDIAHGELVVLVGPSGCGKSTLLRMIAGLEEVDGGAILIDGRDVSRAKAKDRDIAMVFQNYALYPHMTVEKNMAFSLSLAGVKRAEQKERVSAAAAILGLGDYLGRYPRQLSGGQRQRVAMGRAIVRDPSVFLFDEPLSNLDAKLRIQMRTEIKRLHQQLGATMIYVTHDQIEAMTMADTIVVMRSGRLEQAGKPLEVYERPANTFVAEFIGSPSMNLIGGRTAAEGFIGEGSVVLPLPPDAPRDGTVRVYGVRPDHFRLDDGGIPLRVEVVEPTGPETQVIGRLGGTTVTCAFRDHPPIRAGGEILVLPDPARVRLFDADGRRVDTAKAA